MKRYAFILLLVLAFFQGWAQTESIVKHLFFDLPLDSSRETIYKTLCKDTRFIRKDYDTGSVLFNPNPFTYLGSILEQSFVLAKADSIEIELTFGIGAPCSIKKKKKTKYSYDAILRLRYYYKSVDTVENEYQRISTLLQNVFKDSSFTYTDTIFSNVPERRLFKSKGLTFSSNVSCYSIELSNASINPYIKGLFLEYIRKEEEN